jgi:uncharacterized surface protein with fasciclin (FAS1) repeats
MSHTHTFQRFRTSDVDQSHGKKERVKTVKESPLRIDATNSIRVNSATVTKADIEASNGVIHLIDAVLIPKN